MKKLTVFGSTLFVSMLLAGLYGILHDQVTYSISPEYFTKFKFRLFGFEPDRFGGYRQTVIVIGFLATWWTGILIGLGLGITALTFKDYKVMCKALKRAIAVTFFTIAAMGTFGFLYGKFVLVPNGVDWRLPVDLVDAKSFITVGAIHNFSYLGGLLGLVIGVCYLLRRNRVIKARSVIPEQLYAGSVTTI